MNNAPKQTDQCPLWMWHHSPQKAVLKEACDVSSKHGRVCLEAGTEVWIGTSPSYPGLEVLDESQGLFPYKLLYTFEHGGGVSQHIPMSAFEFVDK